jgi:hypothetical protein
MILPKNTTALIQPMDQGIIPAFKAYYRQALLTAVITSELQVPQFLKTVTLKNMAYNIIGLVWKNFSFRIKNCWSKCFIATGDTTEYKEQLLGFM